MDATNITIAVPLLLILLVALIIDLRSRRIPNGLSLGGVLLGIVTQVTVFGSSGLPMAIAGAAVCLICFLPFYIGGGMAAGDVKLMAAVGAFTGPSGGLAACVLTMLAGALIATGCLAWQRAVALIDPEVRSSNELGLGLGSRIPYAGAIALGTCVAMLNPHLISIVIKNGGWT